MNIYCSTGAFVGLINGRNHLLIPEAAKKLDCVGFEFMVCSSWYGNFDSIIGDVSGINFPVIHLDKDIGELLSRCEEESCREAYEKFTENCRVASLLGCKKAVLHLWGGKPSDGHIKANLRAYPDFVRIAREYGLLLTIENVPCNTCDPLSHWRELLQLDDSISFTVDTRFLAFHGQFEEFYGGGYINHVKHVHISDWDAGTMVWDKLRPIPHPGDGHIDFDRFFAFLKESGYNGSVTLESPSMLETGLDSEGLNKDLHFIKAEIE